jgi:hypothetical protein
MLFGDRLTQKQNNFGNILAQVTQELPALRSGLTGFEIGTRRPLQSNTGTNQFTGVTQGAGQQANQFGSQFLNNTGQFAGSFQRGEQNQPTVYDKIQSGSKSFGNVLGGLAGMGLGFCWAARAAAPKEWTLIRDAMFHDATKTNRGRWFLVAYGILGPTVAKVLQIFPSLKSHVRSYLLKRFNLLKSI